MSHIDPEANTAESRHRQPSLLKAIRAERVICPVCGDRFDRKTNNQRLCGRRKCRNEFRRHSERFSGSGYPSAGAVIQSLNSSIKSKPKTGLKLGRAWHIVAGPDVTELNLRVPIDPSTVARQKRSHADFANFQQRAIEVVDHFIEPEWRKVTSPDGVMCFVTRFRDAVASPIVFADDLAIPEFLKRSS